MTALPIDPDAGDGRPRVPPRMPLLGAVFAGGCAGGLCRYVISEHWPAPARGFPWAIFSINTAGAFLLAVIVVAAADLVPSRYLRPLLGTGFCGAFTTFSSVVVGAAELIARHRTGTAVAYLAGSALAGVAAAVLGYAGARRLVAARREAL